MTIDDALAIVDVHLPRSRMLRCPAHNDKTPSLRVYDDSYYCFSCGRNGDAYGLIAIFQGRDVADVLRQYTKPINPNDRVTAVRADPRAMGKRAFADFVTETQRLFDTIRNDPHLEDWTRELILDAASELNDKMRVAFDEAAPYQRQAIIEQIRDEVDAFVRRFDLAHSRSSEGDGIS